jgi:hypothetical protein
MAIRVTYSHCYLWLVMVLGSVSLPSKEGKVCVLNLIFVLRDGIF